MTKSPRYSVLNGQCTLDLLFSDERHKRKDSTFRYIIYSPHGLSAAAATPPPKPLPPLPPPPQPHQPPSNEPPLATRMDIESLDWRRTRL